MTQTDIEHKLRTYIASKALRDVDAIDADEDLLANGVVDSMGVMELVSFMEEELGVPIDDDEIVAENFRSLRAISQFAATKQPV